MSGDARSKRRDCDERARSLVYLKSTKFDRSVVELPPGSMPGSSSDGAPAPPKEKNAYDREIERIEDLLDEMHMIKEQCMKDAFETG